MNEFSGKRPQHEKLDKFFQFYAAHHDKARAAREAGYSPSWYKGSSHRYCREYAPYIAWLQDQHSKEIAKVITVTKQSVIDELAKIAFSNPQDYWKPKTGSTDEAPKYDQVPLHKLPRELAAAIGTVSVDKDGTLTYSLLRKTPELVMLAKAMGLASEKLIVQHHHAHVHARLDLAQVPSETLDAVEKLLMTSGVKVYENGETPS